MPLIVCPLLSGRRIVVFWPTIRGMAKRARDVLAKRIRELRLEKSWSQEHLADTCGLHRTYIGDIERRERNVSIDNIEKIALALKVPITELLSE